MTAMGFGKGGHDGMGRFLVRASLMVLAFWSGGAGAVAIQTEGGLSIRPDGTANYALSIVVPPGTAGVAPALSLSYSSGGGDGILGVGWSLGGLPSITRCAQTIAQDGQSIGVNLGASSASPTGTDRFCYGGQRLVMTSASSYYGADGATYRTEIDGFSQIISHGGSQAAGPAYFEEHTKSGLIQEFGNTADSFVPAVGINGPTGAARSWALDKLSDHNGNYYEVSYCLNNPNCPSALASTLGIGETVPIEINYTGNSSPANPQAPYNSVQFVYGPAPGASGATPANSRAHPLIAHVAGTTSTTSVLLTHVQSFSLNSGGSPVLVHNYQLSYQTGGTGRPQLASIDHCDGGGNCLPATTFNWSNTTTNAVSAAPNTPTCAGNNIEASASWKPFIADLNGDGRDDILWVQLDADTGPGEPARVDLPTGQYQVWLSDGQGGFTSCAAPGFATFAGFPFFGDFAGTGHTDVLLQGISLQTETPSGSWQLEASSGDGVHYTTESTFPSASSTGGVTASQVVVGDFTGVGRSSVVLFDSSLPGGGAWQVYQNIGNYNFTLIPSAANGLSKFTSSYAVYSADFNGDGKIDLLFDQINTTTGLSTGMDREIAFSNGDGTFGAVALTSLPTGTLNTPAYITIGDFNGDGIADLIFNPYTPANESVEPSGKLTILLGRGDGTFDSPVGQLGRLGDGSLLGKQIIAGQFSGTSFTDLVFYGSQSTTGQQELFVSNGDGTFTNQPLIQETNGSATFVVPYVADFLGVGQDSLLWTGGAEPQITVDTSELSGSVVPDLVSSIISGLGLNTTIFYAPISQGGSLYTKDPAGTVSYPTVSQQTVQPAVASVHSDDGIGGTRVVTYSYTGLRADLSGRGSLGFEAVSATDNSSLITNTTSYNQAFPQIGLPSLVVSRIPVSSNVVTLSSTTISYDVVTEVAGTAVACTGVPSAPTIPGTPSVCFVGPSTTQTSRNDLDGTAFPTANTAISYDCDSTPQACYGNPTQQTVSPGTGFQTVTTFTPPITPTDTTNWLVAEIGTVMVQDTVPGEPVLTRTSNFTYFPDTGLLAGSVVEPGQSSTNAAGQASQLQLTTRYEYDNFGNRISSVVTPAETSLLSRSTTESWSGTGTLNSGPQYEQFPQSVTDALGYTAHFGYDLRFGTVIVAEDINNLPTNTSYDTFGRPTQTIGPDGTGTLLAYIYCNTVTGGTASCAFPAAYVITAKPIDNTGATIGPAVTSTYDMLGRVIQTDTVAFDGQGTSRVQTSYNTLGEVTQVTQPFLVGATTQPATQYLYDGLGRVTQKTAPDGSVVTHCYTHNPSNCNIENPTTNPNLYAFQTDTLPTEPGPYGGSRVYVTTRNALGQTVSVTDPIGNPTNYGYFAFGGLASVTDAAGNSVSYSYDGLGRRNGYRKFAPKPGKGFSVEQSLLNNAVVYVRGSLDDLVVNAATRAFIMEVVQEARRLKHQRTAHLTLMVDEVRFTLSETLLRALATILGANADIVTMYQNFGDLKSPIDERIDGDSALQSVRVNSQIKLLFGGTDPETAEWVAEASGTRLKRIMQMEQTEVNRSGGEVFAPVRRLKDEEEEWVTKNQVLALPPRVAALFRPRALAQIICVDKIPVKPAPATNPP